MLSLDRYSTSINQLPTEEFKDPLTACDPLWDLGAEAQDRRPRVKMLGDDRFCLLARIS